MDDETLLVSTTANHSKRSAFSKMNDTHGKHGPFFGPTTKKRKHIHHTHKKILTGLKKIQFVFLENKRHAPTHTAMNLQKALLKRPMS